MFSLDPFGEIVDATSRYLTCPRAYGKCPCISIPHQSNGMEMPSGAIHLLVHVVCHDIFGTFHIFAHSWLCRFQWSANSSRLSIFFFCRVLCQICWPHHPSCISSMKNYAFVTLKNFKSVRVNPFL